VERLDIYIRLLGYLRPYWKQVVVGYIAMLAVTLLNLFVPQIIKNAIDSGLAQGEASALFIAGGIILAIAIVRGVAGFAQRYLGEWLTHRFAYDIRNEFYRPHAVAALCLPRSHADGRPDEPRDQ
jgi:ATP-binding cassette, subfamily B, multidrug efflux pump